MKIAFLTSEYPHARANIAAGIGTSILNLSKGLLQQGHEVRIMLYGQDKDEVFTDNGLTIHKIRNVRIKGFSRFFTQKKIQKLINALVHEEKIDLVEVADWTGISSNITLDCPLVIKLHGTDTYFCHLDHRPVKPLNKAREGRALQRADAGLSVSRYVAELTKQLFSLQKEFTIIPNGVDFEQFANAQSHRPIDNTILYFGTLIRKKGLLELPLIFNEVYRQNKQAKVILIGRDAADVISQNPSTWRMMQTLFEKDALQNVSYLGSVPYHAISEHIQNAAVCVFPSFAEALPVSWIEAMAMEKAIVASDIGWAAEIIDDGQDGFLVHPEAHQEYAAKILRLLSDEALRNDFGRKAMEKAASKFSISTVARQNADFYSQTLTRFKTNRP